MTGSELRQTRRARGLSARDVARAIGVSPSLVTYWERDEKPISEAAEERLNELLKMSFEGIYSVINERRRDIRRLGYGTVNRNDKLYINKLS